jgi:hypothetical protein
VVFMFMCENNRVKLINIGTQHLIPEIWCCIYHHGCVRGTQQDAASKSGIPLIGRLTNTTLTSNHRNATACTRTQNFNQ